MHTPTGMLAATAAGIDNLIEQLQDDRVIIREHAAKQLQRLRSPSPHVIDAVDAALACERDARVRNVLEMTRDTLAKSTAAVLLNSRSSAPLTFPPLCVCCGAPDPTAQGKIMKGSSAQSVRFIWQRPDRIELTVPACETCKQRLDRHTLRAGLMANAIALVASVALVYFGRPYLSWFILLWLVVWVWAYGARLGVRLYRLCFAGTDVVTWPDLCHYDGEMVRFTLPAFQEQFRALNRG